MPFELNHDDPQHQDIMDALSRAPCIHHSVGFCKQKKRCRFSHNSPNCKNWTGSEGSCQTKNCPDRHTEPCLFFAFNKCKFKNKCSRLHKIPQPHNPDLTGLNKDMEILKQQNVELKTELNTMKTMIVEIKEELSDLKANHCKIKENCEKREQKVTTLQDKQSSLAEEITNPIPGIKAGIHGSKQTSLGSEQKS